MSIDALQEKIRKLKNPSMVGLDVLPENLPPHLLAEEGNGTAAYARFCRELLEGLKGLVPAVRFGFGTFALLGPQGSAALTECLNLAKELGFYVLLDGPELLSPIAAERSAEAFFGAEDSLWPCDGLIISPYLGSDVIRPFLPYCKDGQKDLFVAVRTSNKTAPELQDLLTGSRLVHTAAADLVNRYGETVLGKCGYSRVGALAAAGAPDSLRALRGKYKRTFLLLDGYDYPNGNAKNCSYAFDKFGHGAAACAGTSITAAWQAAETDGRDYVAQAVQAAERMKKNLLRYTTIL